MVPNHKEPPDDGNAAQYLSNAADGPRVEWSPPGSVLTN